MSTKHNIHPTDSLNKLTPQYGRRQAVKALLALLTGAAGLGAIAKLSQPPPPCDYLIIPKSEVDIAGEPPTPYPDPDRTAILDEWITSTDTLIVKLEAFWAHLHEVRAIAPGDVDGARLYRQLFKLDEEIERFETGRNHSTDELIEAATGRAAYVVYLEMAIKDGSGTRTELHREITGMHDRAEARTELLALLDAMPYGSFEDEVTG